MKQNIEFIHDFTEDGLKLQAVHWQPSSKDICIVCIHGMAGNIIENYFAHVWGEKLTENNIGFLFGHNRGYSHLNDILCQDGKHKRIGSSYEIFEESIFDLDLWINKAKEIGYKKIVLLGHSFGCNKSLYYLYKKGIVVDGLILASAPDVMGLINLGVPNYIELLKEAEENIENNNPKKLITKETAVFNVVSSETFINKYTEDSGCNNIQITKNPEQFEQIKNINVPILTFAGSKEYPIYQQLKLLKSKATSCPAFTYQIIENTGHTYRGKEEETASLIINWIQENIK